jgi:hypothetical protein
MYTMYACIAVYYGKLSSICWWGTVGGKRHWGEMWAAVIKTINNLLRRSVASSVGAPKWGQSWSQYMPRKGPRRPCSRGASRRLKPKYVHWSIYVHSCKEILDLFSSSNHWKANIQDTHCSICTCIHHQQSLPVFVLKLCPYNNRCLFSQVKNKLWIPWVYTWSWHRREH